MKNFLYGLGVGLLFVTGIMLTIASVKLVLEEQEEKNLKTEASADPDIVYEADQTEAHIQGYYEKNDEDQELLKTYMEYNPDVVGYLRIKDSVLDHPVMQTIEDEDFYLNHDLNGDINSHGIPFLDADCSMEELGGNLVIYGHNIHKISRDVFCDLANYEELEYYKTHPIIDTISESGTRHWLIFAYFITDNADEGAFRYSDYTSFLAERDLEEFLSQVQERNWLDVPVDVSYGDTLITLSSCSMELSGKGTNRMVVIGKLLKPEEHYADIVEAAKMASDPLLPQALQKSK